MGNKIKIGDLVRFLNTTGGGKVKAIRPGNIIEVEDESGFDIPVLASEVVVVTAGSTLVPKVEPPRRNNTSHSTSTKEIPPPPSATRKRPATQSHEPLTALLAYLPADPDLVGKCNYEAYIINESNYDLYVHYLAGQVEEEMRVIYSGMVPFDSVHFVEEFTPTDLPSHARVRVQLMAIKPEGNFRPKPAYDLSLRIEGSRFFRTGAFAPNDYFDDGAILFPLVENDRVAISRRINPEELQEQMMREKSNLPPKPRQIRTAPAMEELVVDLHSQELLDTTAGMEPLHILDYQISYVRQVMNRHRNHYGKRIIFIHGKGTGVLRQALYNLMQREFPTAQLQDASFQEYSFGATAVTIKK